MAECFNAIVAPQAKILILGSMPGVASLTAQQYYAHPRNAFWSIMASMTGVAASADYALRTQALIDHGIALWDVIAACERPGSLDQHIVMSSVTVNDFSALFAYCPQLCWVGLNGGKAFELFKRYVVKPNILPEHIAYSQLPSTSPANSRLNLAAKQELWLAQLSHYL